MHQSERQSVLEKYAGIEVWDPLQDRVSIILIRAESLLAGAMQRMHERGPASWPGKNLAQAFSRISLCNSKRSSRPTKSFSSFLSSSPTNASFISDPNFVRCFDTFFPFSSPLYLVPLFLSHNNRSGINLSYYSQYLLPTYSRTLHTLRIDILFSIISNDG